MAKKKKAVLAADSVIWVGLCPCGCGVYRAVLLDNKEEPIGTFGWDREGWARFTEGVFRMIDQGESSGPVCDHHTAH